MELTVLTKDLIHTLNYAGSIVEKKQVKPIFGNIKLSASGSDLSLTATSNDISLKVNLKAQIAREGEITTPAVTLHEILRKLPTETVTLKLLEDTEQLEVKGGNFISHLSTLPAREFPAIEDVGTDNGSFTINAKTLFRLLTHSEFAMSTEETRYSLCGVYLNSSNDSSINSSALDGHRLASATSEASNASNFGMILPKRIVYELIKILKDPKYTEKDVLVKYDNNRITFTIDSLYIASKLVDATFPDYKSFIPEESPYKLSIHSKVLADAIDRVATVTHDKFKAIKLALSEDSIDISGFGESIGSARESILNNGDEQKFIYQGKKISIGFNPKYMLDLLQKLGEQEIEVFLSNNESPLLIKPTLYYNDRHIIMPMKV